MKLTKRAMVLIGVVIFGLLYYGLNYVVPQLRPPGQAATVPQVQGVNESVAGSGNLTPSSRVAVQPLRLPSHTTSNKDVGCSIRVLTIPWNATMGLMFANGGQVTTANSLMEQYGVRAAISRQDDYGEMEKSQLKFAQEFNKMPLCPSDGAAFTIIMGDGFSAYAAAIVPQLAKLNQHVEVVAVIGKSYGEDSCMLSYKVADNPQLARGSLIGAVLRDGDFNICAAWAHQNGIPINPDEKTYDPQAINFISTDTFAHADEGYITGHCEDRPVVNAGKRTHEMKHICQNGTATWTPGDVNVAHRKGGLAKVASSADYGNQMAAVIIGNREFDAKHRSLVEGMLTAAFAGADQVRSSDTALLFAGGVSKDVYREQTAQYWAKYYKGVEEKDRQNHLIKLGGSRVMDAADNAYYFGLTNGGEDVYKYVYLEFGELYKTYYPRIIPSYPAYNDVVNLTYVRDVVTKARVTANNSAEKPRYQAGKKKGRVVATASYTIEFDTGKSTILNRSIPTLEKILSQTISTSLAVEIDGHTDATGDVQSNFVLSNNRALAVKNYFTAKAPQSFPSNRVNTRGLGSSVPIADNGTEAGRAKNRRVVIILRSTGR